ncbi:MAG: glycosyltransferase family 9 protein [Planctomycetota bacterium]|jgi:GT2 family glycosyltransferase/ADP-heptose:LPS heptosyltransferase
MGGERISTQGITVVLVNYRCAEHSLSCVESLKKHSPGLQILIIDNDSGDDSVARLSSVLGEDPDCRILISEANRGFGSACNLGIEYALEQDPELEYVLLLNPDTVVTAGFLDELRVTFDNEPEAGIVGGRILAMDSDQVLFENGRLRPFSLSRSHVPAPRGAEEYSTQFITGAMMLVAADLLREGLRFDERFFLYVEDLDLCCQVRARGRQLWINRRAVVRHADGGSQSEEEPILFDMRAKQLAHMTRGKLLFARKHFGLLHRLVFLAVMAVAKPLAGVLTGHLRFLPVYYRALATGLGLWRGYNSAVYGVSYRMRNRGRRHRGQALRSELRHMSQTQSAGEILYLAWGRIGDAILATGFLRELRRAFPERKIRVIGRAETAGVFAESADEFISFEEEAWLSSDDWRRDFLSKVAGGGEILICDVHMFYGGVFVLRGLLEALPCHRKFMYEGYELGSGLAPWREEALGVETVARLDKPGRNHILAHQRWYLAEILRRCDLRDELSLVGLRPALNVSEDGGAVALAFDLEPGEYIAFQPVSNNRKKDYPADRWREVLAAFPDEQFVALGSAAEEARIAGIGAPNLRVLAGETDLGQGFQLIRSARAYLGLDSGLSHAAAALAVPGLCVAQNSNLGYFFPYPGVLESSLRTLHNQDYEYCAGCFMTCSEESIFSTYLRGARCLRQLPAERVVAEFSRVLADARERSPVEEA